MFNDLPLFQNAKKEIEALRPSLAVLGDIICKNGLENDIGVNLLHRHFELASHEALVKTVFDEYAVISPKDSIDSSVPYIFKAHGDKFLPTEFISVDSHFYERVKSKQKILENCDELQQALFSLGVSEKLGLFIRHQPFDENGMAWVEDSMSGRELMITKKKVAEGALLNTTETNWYFTTQNHNTTSQVGVVCGICCAIHCGIHCGWHN